MQREVRRRPTSEDGGGGEGAAECGGAAASLGKTNGERPEAGGGEGERRVVRCGVKARLARFVAGYCYNRNISFDVISTPNGKINQ